MSKSTPSSISHASRIETDFTRLAISPIAFPAATLVSHFFDLRYARTRRRTFGSIDFGFCAANSPICDAASARALCVEPESKSCNNRSRRDDPFVVVVAAPFVASVFDMMIDGDNEQRVENKRCVECCCVWPKRRVNFVTKNKGKKACLFIRSMSLY